MPRRFAVDVYDQANRPTFHLDLTSVFRTLSSAQPIGRINMAAARHSGTIVLPICPLAHSDLTFGRHTFCRFGHVRRGPKTWIDLHDRPPESIYYWTASFRNGPWRPKTRF